MLKVRTLLTAAPASDRALIKADTAAQAELRHAGTALADMEIELGEREREKRPKWLLILAALVVVAAVAAVVGGVRYAQSDSGYSDDDYIAAAAARVQVLLTPDGREQRSAQILAGATGEFEDEFAQSVDAYTKFVTQIGAVATGTVDGVGMSTRSGDRATLIVTAAITVRSDLTDAGADEPVPRRFRVQVEMVPDGGSLKISALEFFG
ncbi:hypothetical protein [Williamsia sp.]|uniref:hypothetical protein n=1 Tax=Williamsia sp. TaxID=1872085 RepID=UPI002F94206E